MLSSIQNIRRKVRLTTAVYFFMSGVVTATWASRIPDIQQQFNLSDAAWGGVLSALPIGLVSGLPVSTWLVSRFSSVKVMTITAVIYATILFLLSVKVNVPVLVITLFCFGLTRNMNTLSVNTNAIEVQRLYKKPVIATFHGLWSVACLLSAGLGTLMIANNVVPAWHFLTASILVILSIIVFKRKFRQNKVHTTRRPFFIKPDKYLFLLGLLAFCSMLCEGTVFDWSVNYFKQVVTTDKDEWTYGYTAFITTMSIGRLTGDRFIALLGPVNLLIINGILMATGFIIAVAFPFLWPASLGFLIVGIGDSILVPMIYSLAGKSQKMKPEYALAAVTLIGYVGFLIGPSIIGSISGSFGMRYAFGLTAVLSLCITFITLFMKRLKLLS